MSSSHPTGRCCTPPAAYGTVRIWDVERWTAVGTFAGQHAHVLSLDISDDGAHIATAGTSRALIWNAATFEIEARLSGHKGPVESIEFSPDGSLVLTGCSSDGTARLWKLGDPTERGVAPSGRPRSCVVREQCAAVRRRRQHAHHRARRRVDRLVDSGGPAGRHTAGAGGQRVGADGEFRRDPTRCGRKRRHLLVRRRQWQDIVLRPIVDTAAAGVAFAPDGRQLVSTGPGATDLDTCTRQVGQRLAVDVRCRVQPGRNRARPLTHRRDLTEPGGGGRQRRRRGARHRHARNRGHDRCRTVCAGHADQVVDIEYSPDGSLMATASRDGSAAIWDVDGYGQVRRLVGHTSELTAVTFDHDGTRLATASLDNSVRIWDVETGRNTLTLPSDRPVSDVDFSPDGRYLAARRPNRRRNRLPPRHRSAGRRGQRRLTRVLHRRGVPAVSPYSDLLTGLIGAASALSVRAALTRPSSRSAGGRRCRRTHTWSAHRSRVRW